MMPYLGVFADRKGSAGYGFYFACMGLDQGILEWWRYGAAAANAGRALVASDGRKQIRKPARARSEPRTAKPPQIRGNSRSRQADMGPSTL